MPNAKTTKSQCQMCLKVFKGIPVGTKHPHKDDTGKRCAGSSVSTAHAY